MIFMGELPGKLQNIQQLIAHLLLPLKCTIKYQLLMFQNVAISAVKKRDSQLQLWLNLEFLQWKRSPVLWPLWPVLPRLAKTPGIWSGYPLSPGPPCGTRPSLSGTHRFEVMLAEGYIESACWVFFWFEISFSFRNAYVILLDVLDESRVIELSWVIAVGRQVAETKKNN